MGKLQKKLLPPLCTVRCWAFVIFERKLRNGLSHEACSRKISARMEDESQARAYTGPQCTHLLYWALHDLLLQAELLQH